MRLLDEDEPPAVDAQRLGAQSRLLFVCDHAGRLTPRRLNRLGLPDDAFELHIAWDIGAAEVAKRLAAFNNAACILQRYSRLVVDCNRSPASPGAMPAVSDGVAIPGNQAMSAEDRAARVDEIHAPYHAVIAGELDARQARGLLTVVVFVHSFTPRMAGADRPWQFGVIHDGRSPFSKAILTGLSGLPDTTVGDNEPYAMDGIDYSAPTHAIGRGLDYLELEIRQDLIADAQGQARIADLLQGQLTAALEQTGYG